MLPQLSRNRSRQSKKDPSSYKPDPRPEATASWHRSQEILDQYPRPLRAGSGGGMEATTATILGHSTIHDERADQDFSSESLVAHELAHMWWGDLVTERTWTDVWLSESFATYSEYLWTRHDLGEDEGALNLEDKKSSYLEEARTRYIRPIIF